MVNNLMQLQKMQELQRQEMEEAQRKMDAQEEAMAAEVAQWPAKYGCDGVDLDIETGAGAAA